MNIQSRAPYDIDLEKGQAGYQEMVESNPVKSNFSTTNGKA